MGAVLHRRLGELVADLHVRDGEIRDRVPDGVHQARVTSRRLRSALTTFRPVLVREVTDPISGDLRWMSLGLGDARDAEVVQSRLHRLIPEEARPQELEEVIRRTDEVVEEISREAQVKVDDTLSTYRYHALLASLDRLVAEPPWAKAASQPAEKVLERRLHKEQRRLDRRVRLAREVHDQPAAYDHAMHDVRKSAKRLRYAYEVAEPVLEVPEHRAAAREVTRLLGERQDTVLTRHLLPRIEAAAAAAAEDTEAYRRLHAHEEQRAARLADDALHLLRVELSIVS